jgi:hypothetical protein
MFLADVSGSQQSCCSDCWPAQCPGPFARRRPRRPATPALKMLSGSAATQYRMSREPRRALQDTAVASVRYAGQLSRAVVPYAATAPRRAIIAIIAIDPAASPPSRRLNQWDHCSLSFAHLLSWHPHTIGTCSRFAFSYCHCAQGGFRLAGLGRVSLWITTRGLSSHGHPPPGILPGPWSPAQVW